MISQPASVEDSHSGHEAVQLGARATTLTTDEAAIPTAAEIAAERERTRTVLAEKFGIDLGPDDLAEGQRLWAELLGGNDDALRQGRG